jgi:hypothetical protein
MFARTSSLAIALALVLPAAAGQQYSISSQQIENRSGLEEGGTLGANPVNLSSLGKSAGDWVDPSLSKAGSMSGAMIDATGAHRFDVQAVLTETPIAGFQPRKRYGTISGALAVPGEAPSILMSGSWRLDTYVNKGDFKTQLYMQGPTPMAPMLLLGSMDGVLRRPQAQVKSAPSGGSSGSSSLGLHEPSMRVERSFAGRWSMPSM